VNILLLFRLLFLNMLGSLSSFSYLV